MVRGEDYPGITIVYLCHDGEGHVVLAKRSEQARDERERWDIGGGALEFGQTVEETLKKEIREEYGTTVLGHEFLGFRDVHRIAAGKETHWIALDFKVLVDPVAVTNAEPHKFDEVRWFTLTTLPQPLHSQLPEFLKKYEDKLRPAW